MTRMAPPRRIIADAERRAGHVELDPVEVAVLGVNLDDLQSGSRVATALRRDASRLDRKLSAQLKVSDAVGAVVRQSRELRECVREQRSALHELRQNLAKLRAALKARRSLLTARQVSG